MLSLALPIRLPVLIYLLLMLTSKNYCSMNKIMWILFFILSVGMLVSCEKFLDVNENPNAATTAPLDGLLRRTTQNVALNVFEVSDITSHYTQYLASPNTAA